VTHTELQQTTQASSLNVLVCGLVLVVVMAALSLGVWFWAMRRPVLSPPTGELEPSTSEPPPPPTYVAIGPPGIPGVNAPDANIPTWVNLLHQKMPAGTSLLSLGEPGMTLADANRSAIPAAIQARPSSVTLWCVFNDSTSGLPLTAYLKELRQALDRLTKETDALVVLLNLPDITLLMKDQSEDRTRLVRGGIEQWNRVIAQAAEPYGKRVHLVNLFPSSAEILGQPEDRRYAHAHARLAAIVWREIEKSAEKGNNA
jgi:hypothetical protein